MPWCVIGKGLLFLNWPVRLPWAVCRGPLRSDLHSTGILHSYLALFVFQTFPLQMWLVGLLQHVTSKSLLNDTWDYLIFIE